MDLKNWLKTLTLEDQQSFYTQAARFLSSRELSDIIDRVDNGSSLYDAHVKTGVLDRYTVDLENIRRTM